MLKPAWTRIALVAMIGILCLCVAAWESGFQGQICQQVGAPKYENCSSYSLFPFLLIQIFKALNDYGIAVTALATIAIAAFTRTLWLSNEKMWRVTRISTIATRRLAKSTTESVTLARQTAQRQLRAYVGVRDARVVSNDNGNTFDVEIELINAGQTPARHVVHWMATELQIRHGTPLDFSISARGPGDVPIVPGETFILRRPIAIGGPSGVGTIGPQRTIFAWGRVEYRDIFDVLQKATFRFRSSNAVQIHNGTVMQTVGWRMEAEEEGNCAT